MGLPTRVTFLRATSLREARTVFFIRSSDFNFGFERNENAAIGDKYVRYAPIKVSYAKLKCRGGCAPGIISLLGSSRG